MRGALWNVPRKFFLKKSKKSGWNIFYIIEKYYICSVIIKQTSNNNLKLTIMKAIYVVSNRNNGVDYDFTNKAKAVSFAKSLYKQGIRVWVSKVDVKNHKTEPIEIL